MSFRVRSAVALGGAITVVAVVITAGHGLVRTFSEATRLTDSDQWTAVLRHEQRFVQALQQGSPAEGDDAGKL